MFPDIGRALLPYLGVFVGWLLHEVSDGTRRRHEDRRLAGPVLAELLEIRHRTLAVPIMIREIRKRMSLPEDAESVLRTVLSQLIAKMSGGLADRYNRAIDSAARAFPILTFELRSKEMLATGLGLDQFVAMVAGNDPQAAAFLSRMEQTISEKALPMLNELTLKVARLHGWRTWLDVRRRLTRPEELPAEVRELLDMLVKQAE